MFKTLGNLLTGATEVAAGVVMAPIAAVVDTVSLPASALDDKGPYDATTKALKLIGKGLEDAVKGED